MEILGKILAIGLIIMFSWFLYRYIKQDGGRTLNKANASQSFSVLGILGILLILVVGFAVMALRASP
jgi:TRAP-type C4-dicarboxylate transport system permease small subunit